MSNITLRRNASSLFSPFFDDFLDEFLDDNLSRSRTTQRFLRREDDKLIFEVDTPGVKKDDIKIFLQEGRLSVQFSRNGSKYSRTEYVGDVVEPSAKLEDGVLKVTMKIPNAQKIEIPVE